MDEGLEIVLTPLQFAAVLEGDSIEESSSWSNRFWGAATVVGGAVEMVGGAALLLKGTGSQRNGVMQRNGVKKEQVLRFAERRERKRGRK